MGPQRRPAGAGAAWDACGSGGSCQAGRCITGSLCSPANSTIAHFPRCKLWVSRDDTQGHAWKGIKSNPTGWRSTQAHLAHLALRAVFPGPTGCTGDGAGGDGSAPGGTSLHRLVLAHPAGGTDDGEHAFDYAVWVTPRGDHRANRLPFAARQALRELPRAPRGLAMELLAKEALAVDHPEIMVTALKIASRGDGVIARLQSFTEGPAEVRLHSPIRPIRSAWTCDARERDLTALPVQDGTVRASVERSITSIRLLFE